MIVDVFCILWYNLKRKEPNCQEQIEIRTIIGLGGLLWITKWTGN